MKVLKTNISSVLEVSKPENHPKSKKTYQVVPNDIRKRFIERISSNKITIKQVKQFFSPL